MFSQDFVQRGLSTYHLRLFVFVRVRLYVPDDLMRKKLREFRCLDDVSLDVAKYVVTKCLHDLRDIEERDIYRVALERSHSVLNDKRMITISW